VTEAEIRKARSASAAARLLLENGFTDEAVGNSYYAVFHMARAMLFADKVKIPKTHNGLIATFSESYIKSGRLSRDLGRNLNALQDARLLADYSADSINSDLASDCLHKAKEFVSAGLEVVGGAGGQS